MKKLLFFSFFALVSVFPVHLFGNTLEKKNSCFSSSFSAGYVFKYDSEFKDVYGHGIVNVITADCCYYLWDLWGIGAKISYWRAKGRTTFLQQRSVVQELPATVYVRRRKNFDCGLQVYGSLGGGFIWLKEKSYLGDLKLYKGIGEVEVGLQYKVWRCINVVGAFRYLFPPQSRLGERVDVGGVDLRAGIGFDF